MKKALCITIILILSLLFVGCSNEKTTKSESSANEASAETLNLKFGQNENQVNAAFKAVGLEPPKLEAQVLDEKSGSSPSEIPFNKAQKLLGFSKIINESGGSLDKTSFYISLNKNGELYYFDWSITTYSSSEETKKHIIESITENLTSKLGLEPDKTQIASVAVWEKDSIKVQINDNGIGISVTVCDTSLMSVNS